MLSIIINHYFLKTLAQTANNRRFETVKSKSDHLVVKDYIEELASRGRHHFTSGNARQALGVSANATTKALNRLKNQGSNATPERESYVIVSPEYRSLGCLPAEQFIPAFMA